MQIKILASTKTNNIMSRQEAIKFSGMSAGICYMPDTIESLLKQPEEKAIKRAENAIKNGHHSVFDHVSYNLCLVNIPKILAMILNNEGAYTTSEKSARYTKMIASKQEEELYYKWIDIYKKEIAKKYENIPEKQMGKLAMENARYLISIFTPATTMEYTVSFRQVNYIIQFFKNYIRKEEETAFSAKLKPYMYEFIELTKNITVDGLNADIKERELSLFAKRDYKEEFGECYSTNYKGTFAQLAQAQRHRTLRYNMKIKDVAFYSPEIIENNQKLKSMWQKDISSLKNKFPQGMIADINERATAEDFILKCKQRLCGLAQLEIMRQTKITLEKYIANTENSNSNVYNYLKKYESGIRCLFPNFKCTSPCIWGPNNALKRNV